MPLILKNAESRMRIYRPLIPTAVCLVIGLALGAWRPGYLCTAAAAAFVSMAGMIISLRLKRATLAGPVMFSIAAGYLCIQPWLAPGLPDNHVSRCVDQGKWRIYGSIVEEPQLKQGRLQFILQADRLTQQDQGQAVCGLVQVSARNPVDTLKSGDNVVFEAHLRAVRNFSNPSGFDYAGYMALQGIRTRAFVSGPTLQRLSNSPPFGWRRIVGQWRNALSEQMDSALKGHSPSTRGFLKALILGERDNLPDHVNEAFSRAGVGHVLAISGLHIGLVAWVTFFMAQRLLGWVPRMLTWAWTRKGASMVTLATVVFYGLLAGLSPSTQRAMLMVTVFLLTWWVGRRHDWLNTLAVAALIILVACPPAVLSISFQLSFSAVLAIILGMRRSFQAKPKPPVGRLRNLGARIGAFIWVTALATLGTLPLTLYYFNQVSLVGLAANLVVVPLVGFLAVPCGLLGSVCAVASPALAAMIWQAAAFVLEIVLYVIETIGAWPFAAIQTVTPSPTEIILYYGIALLLLNWKKTGLNLALAGLLLFAGGLDAAYWTYQRFGSRRMTVTAVDVGQGTANLLQLPGGYTVLVDGGGFSDTAVFDVGRYIVAPLLRQNKICSVDLVVLSHANSDHLNGLLYILEHFRVGQVWSNHEAADTVGYKKMLAAIEKRGIRHMPFTQLPRRTVRHFADSDVLLDILAPPPDFQQLGKKQGWRDLNNNSLILKVTYGDVAFLFSGDVDARAEADLVQRLAPQQLHSTVLCAPHHGSRRSGSSRFLAAVAPKEAIISAGWQNPFGFPHPDTMARMDLAGARIWRTDRDGAVRIETDGYSYTIHSCRN